MSNLENIVAAAISRHRLLRSDGAPVIVALSGGADSTALLAALSALGYNCVAAHCNFHLRGEESNRDMRFCRELCTDLGVELYVRNFDVEARRRDTGESVEMACRALRYDWFDQLLDKLRAQAIAVAHHCEDNIETFFLNLLRGSSITGLTGMKPRNGFIVRPMLEASRAEIESYLDGRSIPFVNDSTNALSDFARNRMRNLVLPAIEAQFPGAAAGIATSINFLSQNREFYDMEMRRKVERYFNPPIVDLATLIAEEPCARLILFSTLQPMGFNISQVDSILAAAKLSGQRFTSHTHLAEVSRGRLRVSMLEALSINPAEVEVSLRRDVLSPVHIVVSCQDISEFAPRRSPRIVYFDETILSGNPRFVIRPWRRGDRFRPFGMSGSRLVSDLFRDAKLSPDEKRAVRVLTRNDRIIWVIGLRSCAEFPVTPATRKYLCLTTE